jgi:hypothetical protein
MKAAISVVSIAQSQSVRALALGISHLNFEARIHVALTPSWMLVRFDLARCPSDFAST